MKNQDILIVHPESEEQVAVVKAFLEELKIKFEYSNEENYNSEFVAKIKRQDKIIIMVKVKYTLRNN